MQPDSRSSNDTPAQYRLAILHPGLPCGPRIPCHRPACHATFPGIATVEIVAGHYLARCHGLKHDALGWRADEYAHGSGSSEAAA